MSVKLFLGFWWFNVVILLLLARYLHILYACAIFLLVIEYLELNRNTNLGHWRSWEDELVGHTPTKMFGWMTGIQNQFHRMNGTPKIEYEH